MKRTIYKGYVIDTDNLGGPYIYNMDSPYSEDSDHILIYGIEHISDAEAIIDARISSGRDIRSISEVTV